MILSSKHHFTKLLFEQEHKNLLHAGPLQLLYNIRETYWPVAARNLARSIVHKCIQCYRLKPKSVQPIMGNLPSDRLLSGFPFQVTGTYYAGLFHVLNKRGRGSKIMKGYVCLFICLATKSIYLEFVSSFSTEDFLLALKRFISRRGKPSQIYSDHGTNFIGANRNLKALYDFLTQNECLISNSMNNQGIRWNFNPVQAPHFGGLWEAGVKAMKYHLKRVSGKSNFTVEEFTTLLCQIEPILNSRPLCPLSTNPLDPSPLTPAHFIIGRPLTSILEPVMILEKESRLSRYQKIENARQHFWTRWYKEYISELQQRSKWKTNHGELAEDILVLIKDDKLPPLNWKLGRVTKLFQGSDNISRAAEILTNNETVIRDFSKLCPLP
ncbi:uncharacterized protein LOC130452005 [Diorhabda sublineata]|uniref:uncharacterized protein LOC130452005 n=1 Tax=Diorhabda sublineata TaxID=1163346 RepID=UPI0024E04648|nr:uncharacterized protein LOC130452005 [Diorhabda sublineata]